MRYYIRDPRLWLFGLLALGASIIAAHGSWSFFLLLVDPWLAWIFVGVVALGVVGLAAAGATGRTLAERATYYAGMALFLLLETLANYFWGQGAFELNVVAKAAPGSDLAAMAQDPLLGRVLVALYLALASLAVAAFTHKGASRLAEIRAGLATGAAERATWEGIVRDLREQIAGRDDMVAKLNDSATGFHTQWRDAMDLLRERTTALERLRATRSRTARRLRDLRARLAERTYYIGLLSRTIETGSATSRRYGRQAARRRELASALIRKLREERFILAAVNRSHAARMEEVASLRATHETDREELTNLRSELAKARTQIQVRPAPLPPTRAAVVAYAVEQQRQGRSRTDVAAELGFSESSLRDWERAETNGTARLAA